MPKKAFLKQSPEKKEELLRQAMQLYVDHPYEKITLQMLLDAMGVNPATFYRYFEDKDELYFYMQKLYYDKAMDYLKEKGIPEEKFFLNFYDVPVPFNELENAFVKTVFQLPENLLWRFYNEVCKETLLSYSRLGLRRFCLEGRLRADVDNDLVSYMYATTMFNMTMFFREYGIEDEDIQNKLKKYFYTSFFNHGIISDSDTKKEN